METEIGNVITHKKYSWYKLKVTKKIYKNQTLIGLLCDELHLGKGEEHGYPKCFLPLTELKSYI